MNNEARDTKITFHRSLETTEPSSTELKKQIELLESENKKLRAVQKQLIESTSWKLTAPLREVAKMTPPQIKKVIRSSVAKTFNLSKGIKQKASKSKILWPFKKAINLLRSSPQGQGGSTLIFNKTRSKKWIQKLESSTAAQIVKQEPPLVSIVLPTRNRAHLVLHAIRSILDQTYHNWELIIVDDGSSDNTIELISSSFSDHRIKLLQSHGKGVCEARNVGLQNSSGQLIAYLDSDNTWTPRYLELMTINMVDSKKDCAYAVLKCINSNPVFYRQREFDYTQLKTQNFIDLNVFMHTRASLERAGFFDVALKRMVDWDFIIRIAQKQSISFAYFVGALYDSGPAGDRITNSESLSYLDVVRNKHWIDWNKVRAEIPSRDKELVSVIICVYNQAALTDSCLQALFLHQAGAEFEVILVDNGSDAATKKVLAKWSAKHSKIKLITNPANFNFALGNNIGFANSRGATVVFLNNDTEVSPEWLRPLVAPLEDSRIKGTQPKLLFPDRLIQCVGIVFNDLSPLGYPIYVNCEPNFEPTQHSRRYPAVTAACMAMRSEDFANAGGFDPIYTNGQEDLDLCMRLGAGQRVFNYVSDSVVIHHESKTKGRGANIERNRKIFCERWAGKTIPTDQEIYREDNIKAFNYEADCAAWVEPGYAVFRPATNAPLGMPATLSALQDKTIAIKIGCPKAEVKDNWGDYHFATSLAQAMIKKGIKARIDFLHEWDRAAQPHDINLVIRGLSRFKPHPNTINMMWLISHPEKVTDEEISEYDHVFVASEKFTKILAERGHKNCEPLLQCTDTNRFYPRPENEQIKTDNLFVANSRKVLRTVTSEAIKHNLPINIYGEMWEGLVPSEWIKDKKIDNAQLPAFYSSAEVVLNDHWDDMRQFGFLSNRIFDALACGTPVVTDNIDGIPDDLKKGCFIFDRYKNMAEAISDAKIQSNQREDELKNIATNVKKRHSFNSRSNKILARLTALIEDRPL